MQVITSIEQAQSLVGSELGVSDWLEIDQKRVNDFADVTGDHQWIHVDVERAKAESPYKTPIAHGFLTLSLVAGLAHQTHDITHRSRGINYGSDRVRFTAPVRASTRYRWFQPSRSLIQTSSLPPSRNSRYCLEE